MTLEEEGLQRLALELKTILETIYSKKMEFFLCVAPPESGSIADYISSVKRESGIRWMRETANRLENREDMPVTEGKA